MNTKGYYDGYAAKFDSADGNLVWVKQIGSRSGDFARSITTDSSGNVLVVVGVSDNIDIDGDGTIDMTSNGRIDGFVVKFSDNADSSSSETPLGFDGNANGVADIF